MELKPNRGASGVLPVLARLPDIADRPPQEPATLKNPRPQQPLSVGWRSIGVMGIVAAVVCGAAWWVEQDRRRPGDPDTADVDLRPAVRMADSVIQPAR